MKLFSRPYEKAKTEEIQAVLTGLVYKIVGTQRGSQTDMDSYQELITELARRKVKHNDFLSLKD
jgi:tRNA(Ser,Leu) C12 N-acetylase TAN1